jgi:RNA polymerase sigma-70 factor, ECF subfamily
LKYDHACRTANYTNVPRPESPAALGTIVERAQRGDEKAFEELYHAHKQRVFSLCWRVAGERTQAEDLVQEVFLQLHRRIKTFRGESQFSTWLHRLALNVVLMDMRKKSLLTSSLEQTAAENREEGRPEKQYGSQDHRLQFSLSRLSLERAIRELPPGYRLVFILHDVQGYEHQEVADMMGCTLGNSKSQLHKARLRLRALLKSPASSPICQTHTRKAAALGGNPLNDVN